MSYIAAMVLGGCGALPLDDGDEDGFGAAYDCDDSRADVYPGAAEICDGQVDEDCDGQVDEGDAVGGKALYLDFDGDGHGGVYAAEAGAPWVIGACEGAAGYSALADDCDDADALSSPSMTEACLSGGSDPVDEDCDGAVDEGFDDDGDGYSVCGSRQGQAAQPDCDDSAAWVFPGAEERCDGPAEAMDDDCDGLIDESPDGDQDGYPRCGVGAVEGDCDDANPAQHPGAAELCNGADDDCDGLADEGWDGDGDGFTLCGDSDLDPDCADGDASIFPEATEVCDGRDQDCDGAADEGFTDADGDGAAACFDCDDADPTRSPLSFDGCDTLDDDCDGRVDEGGACPCPVERFGGHTYLFCVDTTDWHTAADLCATYGYHLAHIDGPEENTWLAQTASAYVIVDWWVGLTDEAAEGAWVWEGGEAATWFNWAPGEPNNLGEEDCVGLYPDGTWNDKACSTPWFRAVCEVDR